MTDETIKIDSKEKSANEKEQAIIEQGGIINVLNTILSRLDTINESLETTNKRLDAFEQGNNAQLEAIRSGLVANHSEFARLASKVWSIDANLTDLTEEIRKDKLALK